MTLSLSTNAESQIVAAQLGDLPPKPPRSKLEPHREIIRELRRKGRTYRESLSYLTSAWDLYVAPSTSHSFVKVSAKHHKRAQFELPPLESAAKDSPAVDRIAALKAKPEILKAKPARFVFRENEPLTLTNGGER